MKLSLRLTKVLIRFRDSAAVSFARADFVLVFGRTLAFDILHLAIGGRN